MAKLSLQRAKWNCVSLFRIFSIPFLICVWLFLVVGPSIFGIFNNCLTTNMPWWFAVFLVDDFLRVVVILLLLILGALVAYNLAAFYYRWIGVRQFSVSIIRVVLLVILIEFVLLAYPWLVLWDTNLIPPGVDGRIPFGWLMNVGWLWEPTSLFGKDLYRPLFRYLPLLLPMFLIAAGEVPHRCRQKRKELDHTPEKEEARHHKNPCFEKWRNGKGRALRIGLILAGGGAKGVYQAGALKAIYEFLRLHDNADQNVRMIAGTSIGAWNSLFWLTGLIGAKAGEQSPHEKWWRSVRIERLILFDWFVPFTRNSFLNATPWEEEFNNIFGQEEVTTSLSQLYNVTNSSRVHFYLTRTNVEEARLEFGTNWDHEAEQRAQKNKERYPFIKYSTCVQNLRDLKKAVFASMSLPPFFPYQTIDNKVFEDGGVVENLPVAFGTAVEECDLLFILPLNAAFNADLLKKPSMIRRILQVLNVRQGIIERLCLADAVLYRKATEPSSVTRVVAICPDEPLHVTTMQFWKTEEFGQAFELMYKATWKILDKFDFLTPPCETLLHLVSAEGDRIRVVNSEGKERRPPVLRQRRPICYVKPIGN